MDTFPIQTERGADPHLLKIPWEVAELAYSVYAGRYGTDQSLKRLAKRGGFAPSEMDDFLPDWRKRCEYILSLNHSEENERLLVEVARLESWVDDLQSGMWINCVYCGHRYGPSTEAPSMRDVLRDHVEKCPEHPMSKLKLTLDWIQWLLERDWTVKANIAANRPLPGSPMLLWEWRTPDGISGDDYQSPDFDVLPPAVERHIRENAVMTAD